jgi:hypothetical protein
MKESYEKDSAGRPNSESCVGDHKGTGKVLTGVHAGQLSSREIRPAWVPRVRAFPTVT